jgi:hypothetical protein
MTRDGLNDILLSTGWYVGSNGGIFKDLRVCVSPGGFCVRKSYRITYTKHSVWLAILTGKKWLKLGGTRLDRVILLQKRIYLEKHIIPEVGDLQSRDKPVVDTADVLCLLLQKYLDENQFCEEDTQNSVLKKFKDWLNK